MSKTKLASDVIDRAGNILNDVAQTRWTSAVLIDWLNDGQRAIIAYDPAANTKRVTAALTAGYLQTNPTDCYKLLDIPFNTTGDVISRVIDIGTLYLDDPGWP